MFIRNSKVLGLQDITSNPGNYQVCIVSNYTLYYNKQLLPVSTLPLLSLGVFINNVLFKAVEWLGTV